MVATRRRLGTHAGHYSERCENEHLQSLSEALYECSQSSRADQHIGWKGICTFISHFVQAIHNVGFQIVFDGKKADGIVLKHKNKETLVKAKKEIVLTAGTVGSTKLLLLSGVGPKAHLQSLQVSQT